MWWIMSSDTGSVKLSKQLSKPVTSTQPLSEALKKLKSVTHVTQPVTLKSLSINLLYYTVTDVTDKTISRVIAKKKYRGLCKKSVTNEFFYKLSGCADIIICDRFACHKICHTSVHIGKDMSHSKQRHYGDPKKNKIYHDLSFGGI